MITAFYVMWHTRIRTIGSHIDLLWRDFRQRRNNSPSKLGPVVYDDKDGSLKRSHYNRFRKGIEPKRKLSKAERGRRQIRYLAIRPRDKEA